MKKNGSPAARSAGPVGSSVVVDLEPSVRTHSVGDERVDAGQRLPKPRDEMLRSSW